MQLFPKSLSIVLITICLFGFQSCKEKDTNPKPEHTISETGENFRPEYHFTPEKNWMNDPNGLIFYQGYYHLFYQYYPDGNQWGPMHWGHAKSKDLVNWEHLPIALYPDNLGYIFSGSAVIDWKNTSRFGSESNPAMVAIFTHHDPVGAEKDANDFQYQSIAYSLDGGDTWTKFDGNPVLKNPGLKDFRDPKVFWDNASSQWVMSLAVKDHVRFYGSSNLKDWEFLSEFGKDIGRHGGLWECPDLFPMTDEAGQKKYVLLVSINPNGPQGGSATQYFIGDFNGKQFIPNDEKTRWVDYGADNYAGVTFSNIPKEDGRRLFIGWMSNWQYAQDVPTYNWRSAMTIPRSLILKKNSQGYFLQSKPIEELNQIIGDSETISVTKKDINFKSYLIDLKIDKPIEFKLLNNKNEYLQVQLNDKEFVVDRTKSGITNFSINFPKVHRATIDLDVICNLKMFVDASSIEIFINDGEFVFTDLIFPTEAYTVIESNAVYQLAKINPTKMTKNYE